MSFVPPKPEWLKASTPKQAMMSFHAAQAEECRTALREARDTAIDFECPRGLTQVWMDAWNKRIDDARWEDGSLLAIYRDRLNFHEAALEYLIHG